MRFAKWQGLGNDYLVVDDDQAHEAALDGELARAICDRHFGVGGDGILVLGKSDVADARMRIFNPDGSMAEMCGNGIRMAARYLLDRGHVDQPAMSIETAGGVVYPRVDDDAQVSVDMGIVRTDEPLDVTVDVPGGPQTFHGRKAFVGNPHFVVQRDPDTIDLATVGPLIECHSAFPARTNVEFVRIDDAHTVTMRVWERGVGETLACGSGACAVGVAAVLDAGCASPVTVHLPGGPLQIAVDDTAQGLRVTMSGPAREVFTGSIDTSQLVPTPVAPQEATA